MIIFILKYFLGTMIHVNLVTCSLHTIVVTTAPKLMQTGCGC